ncbi:MAG: cadherin-like beta sandwich domain-containing protein [Clostridia bacterium]|jgi:hypothetical protein|nr:cadherin-like beta sandwich domain-containing protein [Clostridia bacterium]
MNNKILKKMALIILVIIGLIFMQGNVEAAGSFSIKVGKTTLTVGESTTFTTTTTKCGGKFSITSSNPSVVEVGGSFNWVENESQTINLNAKKAGKATITLTPVTLGDSETNEELNLPAKSVTITVNEKQSAPDTSGSKLKSITVAGKTYNNPGTDMTVTVGADVTSTEVSAVASSNGAKISGTGKKELKTGTNTVTLTVTGTNGAKLNYIVRIKRLASEGRTGGSQLATPTPEPTPEENNVPQLLRLSYLMIDDAELTPNFDEETFEYSVFVTNMDKLSIVATANDENANIKIEGHEELLEGDNEVTITLTRGEGDNEEKTVYTIKVNKSIVDLKTPEEENQNDEEQGISTKIGRKIAIGIIVRCNHFWNMLVCIC